MWKITDYKDIHHKTLREKLTAIQIMIQLDYNAATHNDRIKILVHM